MKRILAPFVLLLPFFYILWGLFIVSETDPIKHIYTVSGYTAMVLLFATTSLSLLKPIINFMRYYRRTIGLFAFFYAAVHVSNFFVLDAELDPAFIYDETTEKPFVYLGMTAFVILLFMALTSTKKLFAKFSKYHKLLYVALVLITVHFVMAQKALSVGQWVFLSVLAVIAILKVKSYTVKE